MLSAKSINSTEKERDNKGVRMKNNKDVQDAVYLYKPLILLVTPALKENIEEKHAERGVSTSEKESTLKSSISMIQDILDDSEQINLSFPVVIEDPLLTILLANIPASFLSSKERQQNTEMYAFYVKRVIELLFSLNNSYKNRECFLFKLENILRWLANTF